MKEGVSTAALTAAAEAAASAESGMVFLPLRRELDVSGFGINQLVFPPGGAGRIHRHEHQEEVYLVLEGTLTVAIEGVEHQVGAGELMRVAPAVRRQLLNRSGEPVSLLALGGAGSEHQSRDAEAFTSWDQERGASPREVPIPSELPPPPA